MEEIKVVDISKKGRKEKPALVFSPELVEVAGWQKVRRVYFSVKGDSNREAPYTVMQVVRTRTNAERVNNIRLPKGSTIKLDPSHKGSCRTYAS
ncbi:hypothetical protein [Enterococcus dongliensis]|uniref:hypothetical protein n=1 Tax=Enterococcus dongliensis TaxID=2559925 RepID=UPI0028901151|nr:hypothetical protein [Enterococcus dongliensis]MDT2675215.1 hypothetical protein [Enterococcus dongliensis]